MTCLVPRGLVLVLSLPLALPPGWCCGVAGLCAPPATAPAPTCPACCGHAERQDAPAAPCGAPNSRMPSQPQKPCCRPVDAAPVKVGDFGPDEGPSAALLTPPVPVTPPSGRSRSRLAGAPSHLLIPLQLLHCVWTC
jgi:hypothetical protein